MGGLSGAPHRQWHANGGMAARFGATAGRASIRRARRARVCAQAPVKHIVDDITDEKVGLAWDSDEAAPFFEAYSSQPIERSMRIPSSAIKGTMPTDLRGTLLRNGPGNFDYGLQRLLHPFDGDGLINAFAFEDGEVLMRRKFVRTKAMKDEMAAQRLLYKGAFTSGNPSGNFSSPFDLSVRQPANTGVLDWAGRIMALFERDQPHVLKDTLDTAGRSNLGVWQAEDNMAAHYRVMEEADGSRRLITFTAAERGLDNTVKILELDESGAKVHETVVQLPGAAFGFFHDMLATPNYYVLLENPLALDFRKLTCYVFGQACIAECLYMDRAKPMKIHCIPRPGKQGRKRVVYESANKFAFHHINAWEADGGETIVVDTLATDDIDFGVSFNDQTLEKTRDPSTAITPRRLVLRGEDRSAQEHRLRADGCTEFPTPLQPGEAGRPHSHFFALAGRSVPEGKWGFPQSMVKVEAPPSLGVSEPFDPTAIKITEYYPGDSRYCGEAIFVPSAATSAAAAPSREGYLLALVTDLRRDRPSTTWLEVLDASDIFAGPVAAIDVGEALAPSLHGFWTDRVLRATEDEEVPSVNNIRLDFP
eukprot:jgi/Ulvmu1/10897/UM007_0074.1